MPANFLHLKPAAVVSAGVWMACLSAEDALHGHHHPESEDRPVAVDRMLPPVAFASGTIPSNRPQFGWDDSPNR